MKIKSALLGAALAGSMLVAGAAQAASVTIGNTANGNSISTFGYPDSQTYGEVFTAPISGELTSFSLSLNSGVGTLYGGVGTWNGGASFGYGYGSPTNLYTSATVASTGAQTFTFSPDVHVTAGAQYVAYISVYGDGGAYTTTSQPLGNSAPGVDYFVWNNTSQPQGNASWNYFGDFGNAQFSATVNGVPEASTWVMMLAGFAGLGFVGYRRNKAATLAA